MRASFNRASGMGAIRISYDDAYRESHPWSVIGFWSEYDEWGEETGHGGNYGVEREVRPRFPNVVFDSESGNFFAYAPDKQTALELAEALNEVAGTDYPIEVEEYQQQNLFGMRQSFRRQAYMEPFDIRAGSSDSRRWFVLFDYEGPYAYELQECDLVLAVSVEPSYRENGWSLTAGLLVGNPPLREQGALQGDERGRFRGSWTDPTLSQYTVWGESDAVQVESWEEMDAANPRSRNETLAAISELAADWADTLAAQATDAQFLGEALSYKEQYGTVANPIIEMAEELWIYYPGKAYVTDPEDIEIGIDRAFRDAVQNAINDFESYNDRRPEVGYPDLTDPVYTGYTGTDQRDPLVLWYSFRVRIKPSSAVWEMLAPYEGWEPYEGERGWGGRLMWTYDRPFEAILPTAEDLRIDRTTAGFDFLDDLGEEVLEDLPDPVDPARWDRGTSEGRDEYHFREDLYYEMDDASYLPVDVYSVPSLSDMTVTVSDEYGSLDLEPLVIPYSGDLASALDGSIDTVIDYFQLRRR